MAGILEPFETKCTLTKPLPTLSLLLSFPVCLQIALKEQFLDGAGYSSNQI
jgi:hypothetical protein